MLYCRLLILKKKLVLFQWFIFFRNTVKMSNCLDPDQARHFVGLDLCPDCLQNISAGDKSPLAVNELKQFGR